MKYLYCRNKNIIRKHGFTIEELLTTIAIIGILCSLSVPSFIGWRRLETINNVRNELANSLSSLPEESRRWSSTCTLTMLPSRPGNRPFTIDCRAKGSLKSMDVCGYNADCNISSVDRYIPSMPTSWDGRNLVEVISNVTQITYTPRGHLASDTDAVFVMVGTNILGGDPAARCIVLKAFTGNVMIGQYTGAKPSIGIGGIRDSKNINRTYCKTQI